MKNIILTLIALLFLTFESCIGLKTEKSFNAPKAIIQFNRSDMDYLGDLEGSITYNTYLSFFNTNNVDNILSINYDDLLIVLSNHFINNNKFTNTTTDKTGVNNIKKLLYNIHGGVVSSANDIYDTSLKYDNIKCIDEYLFKEIIFNLTRDDAKLTSNIVDYNYINKINVLQSKSTLYKLVETVPHKLLNSIHNSLNESFIYLQYKKLIHFQAF
jgi:hypothetical protein